MTLFVIIGQIVLGVIIISQLKQLFTDYESYPFFSLAQFSKGIISIGQFSVGFFAFGQFAVGFIAIGQFGIGVINISFIGAGLFVCIAGLGGTLGYGIGGGIIGTYVAKAGTALALFKCKKVGIGFHSIYPFFANGLQSPFRVAGNTTNRSSNSC